MESKLKLSIVIPVRNEGKTIRKLLEALILQEFAAEEFEIIVADGNSSDDTAEQVREFASYSTVSVILIGNPGIRSSAGRNAGLMRSRGNLVVFIDGHCHLPSQTLLRDTVSLFESTKADCLCRPQPLIAPTLSRTSQVIAAARASFLGHGRGSLIYDMKRVGFVDPGSSGASYRRQVFETIGMFDERYDACEDVDLNIRLKKNGLVAYTDPRLAVYYEARGTIRALFAQMLRYGRGRIRLAAKHHEVASVSYFLPLLIVAILFSALVSVDIGGIGQSILFGILIVYVGAVFCASVQLVSRCGQRSLWQAPVVYLAIHLGLGIGMLTELLSLRWAGFTRRAASENNIP